MASLVIPDPTKACFVADLYHGNPVDFGKLAAAEWNGVKCVGVILKCTQGSNSHDEEFPDRVIAARDAGLLVGAYHFGDGSSASAQVNNFMSHASPDQSMGMWLDYEDNPQSQMTLSLAITFMAGIDSNTDRTCGMYSGDTIKSAITKATLDQRMFLAAHAFWIPEYGNAPIMHDDNGKPLPWDVPFLWQWTGDNAGLLPHTLDGLEQGADLNLFNGSPDQLRAAWPLPVIPTS